MLRERIDAARRRLRDEVDTVRGERGAVPRPRWRCGRRRAGRVGPVRGRSGSSGESCDVAGARAAAGAGRPHDPAPVRLPRRQPVAQPAHAAQGRRLRRRAAAGHGRRHRRHRRPPARRATPWSSSSPGWRRRWGCTRCWATTTPATPATRSRGAWCSTTGATRRVELLRDRRVTVERGARADRGGRAWSPTRGSTARAEPERAVRRAGRPAHPAHPLPRRGRRPARREPARWCWPGHLHGGQICLPRPGGKVRLSHTDWRVPGRRAPGRRRPRWWCRAAPARRWCRSECWPGRRWRCCG